MGDMEMKTYFIAIDFHKSGMNKFINDIVEANLTKINLQELAKETIANSFPNLSLESITIKVTAFNNVEV